MAGKPKSFTSAAMNFVSSARQELSSAEAELNDPAPDQRKGKLGALPTKKLRQKRVQAVLTDELFSKVQKTADEYGLSISETINQILIKFYS